MAVAQKVYDFPLAKVEDQLVSFLKQKRGESTVADMIAGTGLPKYQVEQAAQGGTGRIRRAPEGHRVRGASVLLPQRDAQHPARRGPRPEEILEEHSGAPPRGCWRSCSRSGSWACWWATSWHSWPSWCLPSWHPLPSAWPGAATAGAAAVAVTAAALAACILMMQLFDLVLRMWFWSSILKDPRRKPRKEGRAFYKSVFGFAFGEGDPNQGWDEAERKYIISYICAHKGVHHAGRADGAEWTGDGQRQRAPQPPPPGIRG